MKKIALITLLLVAVLGLTACGGPSTFEKADTAKYLTLGEYKNLTYTPADTSVSDYEMTVAINSALKEKGYAKENKDIDLKEGVVMVGDTVNINYKGLKNGVAFEGGTASKQSLTIGSGQFIDGFEEGLVGKAIGSDVKLNLTFPKDYQSADLAGQAVVFEVKINSVTTRIDYSELTDKVASELNSETKTVKEYKDALKASLENTKKTKAEEALKSTLWSAVITNAKFEEKLPEKLVDASVKEFEDYYKAVATQSQYTLEEFVKAQGTTMAVFNEQAKVYAENIVKSQLAAYAIAKAEGYTVSDKVYQDAAAAGAAKYGYPSTEKYIEEVGATAIRDQAVLDYAVDLVVSNAKAK